MNRLIAAVLTSMSMSVAQADVLTPERAFGSPDLSGPQARGLQIAPDGSAVTYLKAKDDDIDVTDLWIADVKGGDPRMLIDGRALSSEHHELSEAEKSRRERMGQKTHGVVEYHWDDLGQYILAPVQGDLWLYERQSGHTRRLTETPGDEVDGKISPKGGFVSFVRDDNVYVMPLSGGAERALTTDGTELKSWGTAEFIAQEELQRYTGYWWSPDETKIALTWVDQEGVDVVERLDIGADGARVVPQRYPRVGRANAVVKLFIVDLATNVRTPVDLGSDVDFYLARTDWSRDGKTLYVQRLTRDQKRLDLLAVNPRSGSSRVILSEVSEHWVPLNDDFKPLKDGGFLWSSERSGNNHLYLYGPNDKLIRAVTQGEWPVAKLEGLDDSRHLAFFSASKETPIERRLYQVSWQHPAEPRALTPAGGWWDTDVSKSGAAFVGNYSDPKTPPQSALYKIDGSRIRWVEENRLDSVHPFHPYLDHLRVPEFGTILASDGQTLHWSMRTPPDFDPTRRYPVIVQVYGGPAGALVERKWAPPSDQLLTDAGYILFRIDNRGTPNRSVKFKTAIDRRTGGPDVEDQLAGAAYLKSLAFVDASRLGVTGYSNGGYMTLMLLTETDSPFSAGVAGAPVSDWTLYDTAYTERYMGTPSDNADGYRRSQVIARLGNLRPGSLLLIHGMADDNVIFENSTRVIADLQARGIAFEMMTYPGLRHRTGWTQKPLTHRMLATLDFFGRKLAAPKTATANSADH